MKKQFRSFEDARRFVHSLKLKKGDDWRNLFKSKKLPNDLPYRPERTYKNKGWEGWGNFLGTGNIHPRDKKFIPYGEAQKIIQSFHIKSSKQYRQFLKDKKIPNGLPSNPDKIYNSKWSSWGDFLGTGIISVNVKSTNWLDFKSARRIIHLLKLKSSIEWRSYCKSGKKRPSIPSQPNRVYKNKGWKSMGDWLGTGRIANQYKKYRTFTKSRKYAHSLKLKGKSGWSKSTSKFPIDIPVHPERVYKKQWKGWGNWLGTGEISVNVKSVNWLLWKEAKPLYQKIKIENKISTYSAWMNYVKTHKLPKGLPPYPADIYTKERIRKMIK